MNGISTRIWKRPGKRGMRYMVRWMEPGSGKDRSKTFQRLEDARAYQVKLRQDVANGD